MQVVWLQAALDMLDENAVFVAEDDPPPQFGCARAFSIKLEDLPNSRTEGVRGASQALVN